MDFNSAIDLIKRELEETWELIDDLKNTPGIPIIQIELAKSKCRNAANVLEYLKTGAAAETVKAVRAEKSEELPLEHVKLAEAPKPIIPEKPKNDPPVLKKKAEEEKHLQSMPSEEPVISDRQQNIEETDPDLAITAEEDSREPEKPFVAPIIADSFSHLATRYNEQMGKGNEDPSYLKKRHLTKLSDAIGVNDKFYYVREIFDGDKEAYSDVISHLENIESVNDAKKVIMSHRKEKTENQAVKQLLNLVKRKLTPDE